MTDKIWMDEVAAMQASYLGTSGIILIAGENNDLSQSGLHKSSASDSITRHRSMDKSDGRENGMPMEFNQQQTKRAVAQLPIWAHHFPQYKQNSQAPIFQPYPGYIFPGMQVGPSQYPSNMPWTANFHDSRKPPDREIKGSQRHKSHKKKERHTNTKNGKSIETDHSNSSDDHNNSNNKRHNKSSSRKVVIRNINYIASSRNEYSNDSDSLSSIEDEYVNADSLKEQVEEAVGSLKLHHKPNSDKSKIRDGSKKTSNKSKNDLVSENEKKDGNWDIFQNLLAWKSKYASDDFLFTERSTGNGIETNFKFEGGENLHGVVNRRSKNEEFLIPPRAAEGEHYPQKAHFSTEPSIIKTRKDGDWIIGSKSEIRANPGGNNMHNNIFSGDQASASHNIRIVENKKDVLLDDSFMVQSRISDGPPQTRLKDDIFFMVTDIVGANNVPGNLQASNNFYEPEDLKRCYIQQGVASWSNEMEYKNDVMLVETVGSQVKAEPSDSVDAIQLCNGKASKSRRKVGGKEPKSKAPSGSFGRSKSDVSSRSKISTSGNTMIMSKSEKEEEKRKKMEELLIQRQKRIAERSAAKGNVDPETSKRSSKESKRNNPVSTQAKLHAHKPAMRSSTIDRLAAARTTNKPLSTEPKVGQNKQPTPKAKSVTPTSSMKNTKGTQDEKKDKVNPLYKKNGMNSSKISSSNIQKRDSKGTTLAISEKSEKLQAKNGIIEAYESTVKVLHTVSSFEKRESNTLSSKDLLSSEDINVNDQIGLTSQITADPTVGNDSKSNVLNIDEKKKLTFSPEISVVNISTPPETDQELIHSRKKWNNGESSPKIPKGFRRLLLFGRKT